VKREKQKKEGRHEETEKTVPYVLDVRSPKIFLHLFQGPSCIPEHFPSPIFAN
jgi:hypothetical protein